MPTTLIVWTLTALAAVVVVLTRLRLGRPEVDGPAVAPRLLLAHTVVGVVTLVLWVVFLVFPADSFLGSAEVGIVAVGGWWVLAGIGLVLLARWRRPKGRRAASSHDEASRLALVLSVVGHVGMLLGVVFLTWAYTVAAV